MDDEAIYYVKVNHPDFKDYLGTSDCIDTYCCEALPSWFVFFYIDGVNYEGYFHKSVCEIVGEIDLT